MARNLIGTVSFFIPYSFNAIDVLSFTQVYLHRVIARFSDE